MTREPADGADTLAPPRPTVRTPLQFERMYRANVGVVTAYFARRCWDPQDVADLTSETVLQAAGSFGGFDPSRGTARAWLLGIAAHVYAHHCARVAGGRDARLRLTGRRPLETDELEELAARIDAQRAGRELLKRCAALSAGEREAIEAVDLMELSPKEAAAVLEVSRGVLRMRLFRARARLKKGSMDDGQV